MSLDNGTFIFQLKNLLNSDYEYYVCLIHAIQNILRNHSMLFDVISEAKKFTSLEEARKYAYALENDNRTELGACLITAFEDNTIIELEKLKHEKERKNELHSVF